MSDRLQDDADIRDLVYRYADAVCRRDQEAWSGTWAEDGVWQLPGAPRMEGREAIVGLWAGAMAGFPFVAQIVHYGLVDIDGDTARRRLGCPFARRSADMVLPANHQSDS